VAFQSAATNLIAQDRNGGAADIFVKHTVTGSTFLVSLDSSGNQAQGQSFDPAITGDGSYIAFETDDNGLVAGDSNNKRDIMVRDSQAGTTSRVSTDSSGAEGNGNSYNAAISADGRWVAFESDASDLVAGDNNGKRDVFLKDRQNGATTRVSTDSSGSGGNGDSFHPSVSADGRYIAFESDATNLAGGDSNGMRDIFVKDRQTGATTRVSTDSSGAEASNFNSYPSISADGRWVAFESDAADLVSSDTNHLRDVFVKDRQTGTTVRVSTDSQGNEGHEAPGGAGIGAVGSEHPSLSADGRYVTFQSDMVDLVTGDTNVKRDIFIKDVHSGATVRLSEKSSGGQANGDSSYPAISPDGSYTAFQSDATNLVGGDNNARTDIFRVATIATDGTRPQLSLSLDSVYWNSLADYQVRNLSIDLSVANAGTGAAYGFRFIDIGGNNGVSLVSILPEEMELISGGSSVPVTVVFHVPDGVSSFVMSISAAAEDGAGNGYSYP
jgi:Tol biopolymer transport system component